MKKLNSLILTTFVLFGSVLVSQLPAFSVEPSMNVRTNVKADGDISAETLAQKLNLTDAQKKSAAKILVETNQKIVQYLNPDQRKKLEAGLKSKQGLGATLKSLNLSADQKKNIGAVLIERRNRFVGILNAEQKKKFEALAPLRR